MNFIKKLFKYLKYTAITFGVVILAIIVIAFGQSMFGSSAQEKELEKLATAGGFTSVLEYQTALKKEEEAAVIAGGFVDISEYRLAKSAGMPTKLLYDEYVLQQAAFKLAEEKRIAEEAEKQRLAEEKRKELEAEKSAELSASDFKNCKSEGGSFYTHECLGKTVFFRAIVGKHGSDGVPLAIKESCDSVETLLGVDAPNLSYGYSKNNLGKCVSILAYVGKSNFTTPDVNNITTFSVETNEEKTTREADTKRQKEEEERKAAQKKAADLKANKEDASWLSDNYGTEAGIRCRPLIERLAKNQFEWTDSWSESKFSSYLVKTSKPYVLTVVGDKIKFQNGFGAWTNMKYYCDYNVKTQKAFNPRVR